MILLRSTSYKGQACRTKPWRSMVPGVGIEPTTLSSSGLRSTTELPRRIFQDKKELLRL